MQFELLESNTALPLVVTSQTNNDPQNLCHWIRENRPLIEEKLLGHGAILFRGFSVDSPMDFQTAVRAYEPELVPYIEGQSRRTQVLDKIYNSTYYPSAYEITIHNELSYTQMPPSRIYFCCLTPPAKGGETPLLDCHEFLQNLDPEIRERFQEKGIRYVKNMHGGRGPGKSWQEHFESSDRDTVENYLNSRGVEYEWRSGGWLRTVQVRPAVIEHPQTGRRLWFNQATLWHPSDIKQTDMIKAMGGEEYLPTHAYFGDGTQISAEDLDSIRSLSWELAILFRWRAGDFLMVDNLAVAHGRKAFEGPRNIVVAMA